MVCVKGDYWLLTDCNNLINCIDSKNGLNVQPRRVVRDLELSHFIDYVLSLLSPVLNCQVTNSCNCSPHQLMASSQGSGYNERHLEC